MYSIPRSVFGTGLQIRLACADRVFLLVLAGAPAGLLSPAVDSTTFERSWSDQKWRYAANHPHCFGRRIWPSLPTIPSGKKPSEYRPIALPALTVKRKSSLPTVGRTPAALTAPPHFSSMTAGAAAESARTCRTRPWTEILPNDVLNRTCPVISGQWSSSARKLAPPGICTTVSGFSSPTDHWPPTLPVEAPNGWVQRT